ATFNDAPPLHPELEPGTLILIGVGLVVGGGLVYKALDNGAQADKNCKDFQTHESDNCKPRPPCSFYSGSAASVSAEAEAATSGGKKMLTGHATLNSSCDTACICPNG